MATYQTSGREKEFAEIIWASAPVKSGELAAIAKREFGWARTTAYTVLRRLMDKGLFENDGGEIRPLVSKEEFEAEQSREFVDTCFGGSLPGFLNAFSDGKQLSSEEICALQALIEKNRRQQSESDS